MFTSYHILVFDIRKGRCGLMAVQVQFVEMFDSAGQPLTIQLIFERMR